MKTSRTVRLSVVFVVFSVLFLVGYYLSSFTPESKTNTPVITNSGDHNSGNWDFQTDYICPDVKRTYNPLVVKEFLEDRKKFYYQLTDYFGPNSRYRDGKIFDQWSPPGKFYDIMGPVVDLCPTKSKEWGTNKTLCDVPEDDSSCVVLSIGGNNEWDFERQIVGKTKCKVHTFDCTLPLVVPPEISSRVTPHQLCVSQNPQTIKFEDGRTQKFITYAEMLKYLNIREAPTILKMDIEGHEFGVLRSVFSSLTTFPSQIAIELHFGTLKSVEEAYLFTKYLWEAGYALIARIDNPTCTSCTDVLLKRIFCN